MTTRLNELLNAGQSVWLDSIRRKSLLDGEMAGLIADGVRGETANPTIFEKALSTSDYDDEIRVLAVQGKSANEMYETLLVQDVQTACDLFRELYDQTDGADGFVSLEVSPKLARDTQGTMSEVRRFWKWVDRPNLMIKIPGTLEGVPAVEQMLYEGVNVNITLLFGIAAYEAVAWAYIHALERRLSEGLPIHRLASVASFFVSRIDTLADKLIAERIKANGDPHKFEELKSLEGRAAIANAKLAYESFQKIFGSNEFRALADKGARVQRPLWASTSTKNPAYPDTMYVDSLIGPDTINTLPLETIHAFSDHGIIARTVDKDIEGARATLAQLAANGIHIDDVTSQVLNEGILKFDESLEQLLDCIEAKRAAMISERAKHERANLGALERAADLRLSEFTRDGAVNKVWAKDASLWSTDASAQKAIKNRLGWLSVSKEMSSHIAELRTFSEGVRGGGFTDAVLCGMGGSSLGVEVLAKTFGTRPGFLKLHVLDTTDPVTIATLTAKLDLNKTLFVIASKSGSTAETNAHFKFFWERLPDGNHFVAITDPGTVLETLAVEHRFRNVFSNPADIGGRYSVLSYFGMVCGALLGIDLDLLFKRAEQMRALCSACVNSKENPGLWLGVILGELAKRGRDKVTIIPSSGIESFGAWAEQLIAESTGKQGKGIIPISGETLSDPVEYGDDRLFVYLKLEGAENGETETSLAALERAGHLVVRLYLADTYDLGAEFFRWEFATAIAGAVIGVNPFDEPNVTESKENTQRVLKEGARRTGERVNSRRFQTELSRLFEMARPGDYFAFMAYLTQTEASDRALERMRLALRDRMKIATTVGYGPRFLHSTGQLHKGGPNTVLAFQITYSRAQDEKIPAEQHTFGELLSAQSEGDWQSLQQHGRRAVRVHLKSEKELPTLAAEFEKLLADKTNGKKGPVGKRAVASRRANKTKQVRTRTNSKTRLRVKSRKR